MLTAVYVESYEIEELAAIIDQRWSFLLLKLVESGKASLMSAHLE